MASIGSGIIVFFSRVASSSAIAEGRRDAGSGKKVVELSLSSKVMSADTLGDNELSGEKFGNRPSSAPCFVADSGPNSGTEFECTRRSKEFRSLLCAVSAGGLEVC